MASPPIYASIATQRIRLGRTLHCNFHTEFRNTSKKHYIGSRELDLNNPLTKVSSLTFVDGENMVERRDLTKDVQRIFLTDISHR